MVISKKTNLKKEINFKDYISDNIIKEELITNNKRYYHIFLNNIPVLEIRPSWKLDEDTRKLSTKYLVYDLMYDILITNTVFEDIDSALDYGVEFLDKCNYKNIFLSGMS